VAQNLANYLPPPSDPRYAEFEKKYPTYKRDLEERYPQVCRNCEPRVKERIKQAGYAAKTDHLRRMMDKTRQVGIDRRTWTPSFFPSFIGFILWASTVPGFLLWNGFGAFTETISQNDGLVQDSSAVNLPYCLNQIITVHKTDISCATTAHSIAGWAVAASIASSWWNPIMRRRNIDRAVGLQEYYKLQFITVGLRYAVWYILGRESEMGVDPSIVRAIHATMLAFNLIIPIITYRTAYISKSPRVSFQESDEPLVSRGKIKESKAQAPLSRPTSNTDVNFPIHKLGSGAVSSSVMQHGPTITNALSLGDLDYDPMEIDTETSPTPFNLHPSRRMPEPKPFEPSPFQGRLPPAPASIESKVRNPFKTGPINKDSGQQQEGFFPTNRGERSLIDPNRERSSPEVELQPQRLFLNSDSQETGLESKFSNFFSLSDVTENVQLATFSKSVEKSTSLHIWGRSWPILMLLFAMFLWRYPSAFSPWTTGIYYLATGIGAVISGRNFEKVWSSQVASHSDILLNILEISGAAVIGYQIRKAKLANFDIDEVLGPFPLWYFGFLLVQEFVAFTIAFKETQSLPQIPTDTRSKPSTAQFSSLKDGKGNESRLIMSKPASKTSSVGFASSEGYQTSSSFFNNAVTPTYPTTRKPDFPGSNALSGLSLGLGVDDDDDNGGSKLRRSARTLRNQKVNPWEVGKI
jgi:hypothetical protein